MNHDLHRGTPDRRGDGGLAPVTAAADVAIRYRGLTIGQREASALTSDQLVRRLVDAGASRLTAERIVVIERGDAAAGRARRHGRGW